MAATATNGPKRPKRLPSRGILCRDPGCKNTKCGFGHPEQECPYGSECKYQGGLCDRIHLDAPAAAQAAADAAGALAQAAHLIKPREDDIINAMMLMLGTLSPAAREVAVTKVNEYMAAHL